jgi:hypothetical protein
MDLMSVIDWKKVIGPWPFTPQLSKWGYLNNPRWQQNGRNSALDNYDGNESSEPQIWPMPDKTIAYTIGDQIKHSECGHWHTPVPPLSFPWWSCPMNAINVGNGLIWFFTTDDKVSNPTIYILQYNTNKQSWTLIHSEAY